MVKFVRIKGVENGSYFPEHAKLIRENIGNRIHVIEHDNNYYAHGANAMYANKTPITLLIHKKDCVAA